MTLTLPHGSLDPTRRLTSAPGAEQRSRGAGPGAPALVKYADFDCPGCREFHAQMDEVPEALRARFRFVHRHFPLVDSHPRAIQSALAAEAAGAQDAFWPMYDILFTAQRDREVGAIYRYAESLGLDVDAFRGDVRSRRFAERIWRDLRSGRASGVETTPGLFLEGVGYAPTGRAEELVEDLEAWLEEVQGG